MQLAELFAPQTPTPKKKSTDTVPEVFIIDSLELTDEPKERREGAVLAAVLKMCGNNPLYYYIRTKAELELAGYDRPVPDPARISREMPQKRPSPFKLRAVMIA